MNEGDLVYPKASFADKITKERRSGLNQKYVEILANYGGLLPNGKTISDITKLATKAYSIPIYDVADATTTVRFFWRTDYQNVMNFSMTNQKVGVSVPWNPSWSPGVGNDKMILIADYKKGEYWAIFHATIKNDAFNLFDSPFGFLGDWAKGPNGKAGYSKNASTHFGAATVNLHKGMYTATDRDRLNPKAMDGTRGSGLPKMACLIIGKRVLQALERREPDIGHAIPMSISITMHGPDESKVPGYILPPARKFEWKKGNWRNRCKGSPVPYNDKCVPQGMMMALKEDFDVEGWLNKQGFADPLKSTIRIIVNTMKTRGIVLGIETGCGASILIGTDGIISDPESWAKLGIRDDRTDYPGGDMFKGLFDQNPDGTYNFEVIDPPKM